MSFTVNPIVEECRRLRKALIPISEKNSGLTKQIAAKNTLYPFVLLLGNHSSGKSSFINHILNRRVQTTGVAPTDDNFTIIGPGDADIDRSGPALVGDPDLGFSDLQAFGPVLVNHTQLKVRTGTNIKNFMIVDSPGMIDSPVTDSSPVVGPVGTDRGYNFEGVCRWYAERADVILLFFDPDKPGTTGETLSILTTALVGLDHKLFILLNKADQFRKIHDFARAYGSLCWNLSKVIPRKDLPRIHTMCIPVSAEVSGVTQEGLRTERCQSPVVNVGEHDSSVALRTSRSPSPTLADDANSGNLTDLSARAGSPPITQKAAAPKTFFEQGIHDLEESRLEIEKETFNAPLRRVDNEITRLTEAVSALLMHCTILDRVLELYYNKLWRARALTAGTLVASVGITVGVSYLCDFLLPPAGSAAVPDTAGSTVGLAAGAKIEDKMKSGGGAMKSSATGGVNASRTGKGPQQPIVAVPLIPVDAAPPSSTYSALWNWQSKFTVVGWTAVCGALSTVGVVLYEHITMTNLLQTFNEKATYETIFRSAYQKELAANNESTLALGRLVLDAIPTSLNSEVIQKMQRVDKVELTALHRILNEDIPNLRRRASPDFPMLSTPDKLLSPHSSLEELSPPPLFASPSAEALERAPYKSSRALVHPDMHVHFSPSTASSPITTRERGEMKRSLQMHFPEAAPHLAPLSAGTPRPHSNDAVLDTPAQFQAGAAQSSSVLQQEYAVGGIAFEQDDRVDSPPVLSGLPEPEEKKHDTGPECSE